MHTCPRSLWIPWLSISLALVLSSCGAQAGKTAPPSTPVPQTPVSPRTPPSALRVGIAPTYPPLACTQQGHLTGLEVDLARGLEVELGRRLGRAAHRRGPPARFGGRPGTLETLGPFAGAL
jgi:ABC-type amino acid transport substrate-binding protein